MNEHSRNKDSRIVVKFPGLAKKLWSSTQRGKNKPPTKEACTPCCVLLLKDTSLDTKSLQEFDEQWAVCIKRCLKRRVSKNSKIFDNSCLSKTARKDTPATEKYQVVIKEEPPFPQPDPTDNTIQDKSPLPQHLQKTRQMKTRNTDPNKQVTVEVKVELVESDAKGASNKTKENKRRGVNRDFLIKGTAEICFDSLKAPELFMSKTTATKLGRFDSIDNTTANTTLQQFNSKTAIVQPRMSSATSTVNLVTYVQTPTVPSASSNLLTLRETNPILPGVVNVDMSKLSSLGTSSVIKAGDQTTIPPMPTPSVQSTDEMCILQLMNGQMVLLPIDTVRQLSANISSPLVQTGSTANVVNIPTIYSLNPGTTDPFMSPLVQPGITYLAPTGPNLLPPTITPQICNFAPRLVGQQTITNPIVYMPQTSNPNTTLIWQQNNKQSNIISSPNILPSSVQIPNVLPVAQPPVYPVVSAPKPATPTVNTKPISNTSYLRLADGQLVPIVNDSAALGANKPSTTTVKHEAGGVTTVSFSAHSGLPLTNSVLSANVPTVNPVQYVPTAPPPPRPPPPRAPPAISGPANRGSPRFLQFPNGSLVPIVDQNVSCTNNQTRVIYQTSTSVPVQQTLSVQSNTTRSAMTANVPVKQTLSVQSNTTRGAMTASQLVKKHIQNSKMRSIRPAQTQVAPQNVKMASINEAQQSHVVKGNTHQNGPRFQESIFQILNTKTDLFQSEDSSRDTTGLLKKPAPSILNSSKSKETNETPNTADTSKPASGPLASPCSAKNRNTLPFYALAPKPDLSLLVPATPTNIGVSNPPKTGSKRKSVNIVREDFDARKKTKSRRGAQKPTGKTYFTQEVIDVDEEEERKKKAGKDGRPQFMFMRSVSKPEFRPVLLDSTIEEKGLRLPDSMVI